MDRENKAKHRHLQELDSLRQRVAELELREMQNREINEELSLFKSIVEASHEAIAISDPKGRLLYINPAHEKLFGRSLEEAKKLNYRDYYPPESVEVLNREVAPALERGESWEGELEVFDASGHRFHLWERAGSIRDIDGRMLYGFGLMHDITARKRAEAALREHQEALEKRVYERTQELSQANVKLQEEINERRQTAEDLKKERDFIAALLDTVGALVVVLDKKGHIVRFNQSCQTVTGYRADEVLGRLFWEIFLLPEEREAVMKVFQKLAAGQFPATYENHWLTKDGEKVLIAWSNTAMAGSDGRADYIIGTGIDITASRQAEMALKESEQRYSSLFENNHAVMLLIDPETANIIDANPAACSFYGMDRTGLTAKKITDINTLPPDQVFQEMQRARSREHRVFHFRHRLATGDLRDVEVFSGPIEVRGRQLLYSIVHDITERKRVEEALRQSETRFRELAESIQEVFWVFDWQEQQVLYASPAYEQVWGRSVQALYDDYGEWAQSIHPDDVQYARESFQQILATGGGEPREYRIVRPDGSIRWVSDRGFTVLGEHGDLERIVGIAEDITVRKQAEERLKAAEAEKALVLSSISELVVFYDPEMRLKWANRAAEEVAATPLKGLKGRYCYEVWHGRTALCEGCPAHATMASGESQRGEMTFPDGKSWLLSGTPVKDQEGRVIGVVETALEITDRKRAEAALRQSEERFRAIFDHVSVGMALVDANGCVLMANDADCRFLGYPREELVGLHFSAFTHPGDVAIDAELYESLLRGERESYVIDKRYIRKDGDIVWGRLSVSLIRDDQEQPQYTVIACEDITEQRRAEEALKRSQRQLKAILDNIPDFAWLKDRESRFIAVNEPFGQACGVTPEDLVGRTDLDIWPRELAERYRADDMEVMRSGQRKRVEEPLPAKDGSAGWIETIKTPIYDDKGEVIGTTGIARDITARRQAEEELAKYREHLEMLVEERTAALTRVNKKLLEEIAERERTGMALRESEEKYRTIVETAQEGIWVIDAENKTSYVNQRLAELLGYKPEEMLGAHLFDFIDEEARREAEKNLEQTHAGVREVFEFRFRRQEGSDLWTITSTNPLFDTDGHYVGALGMLTDISKRRQAEMALRESEVRFRKIFEESPIGIGLRDLEGYFLETNPALERILGYGGEELRRLSFPQLIHPEDEPSRAKLFQELMEGQRDFYTAEFRFFHKDGSLRWNHVHVSLIHDANRCPLYSLAMLQDITREKQAEEELAAYQENLRSLASELSLTEERERRRLADFLHDDVGQALALAKIKLGELTQEVSKPKGLKAVNEVRGFLERAIGSTRNLTFELGLPILYEMGLEEAVEWLAEQFHIQHGLKVEVKRDQAPKPLAEGARVLLFRLVRELLTNVVKHARANKVMLSFARQNDLLFIQLQDDGIGFDTTQTASPAAIASGFGLFSVRERLSHLGGHMEVNSNPGRGTRVSIIVPLMKQEDDHPAH